MRAVRNESSQYILSSEINDQVQRSLIVRQVNEGKTARVVEHNQHSATEGQEEEAQVDLGFNGLEELRPREANVFLKYQFGVLKINATFTRFYF